MTNDASQSPLGRVLVERGVISQEQLDTALVVQRTDGGMLGEILTSRGWVTPLSIAAALAKQKHEPAPAADGSRAPVGGAGWKPLGTLLVERGCITQVQLEQALASQGDREGFLGEILVAHGWLSASDLVLALAAQLGLEVDISAEPRDVPASPAERPTAHFEVLEGVAGEIRLLSTADTFMEATDFVFDEVLSQRDPGDLQIVRIDGERHEVVWSFRPDDASAQPRKDMLSVFGYAVGHWEDTHRQGPEDASQGAPR